MNLSKIFFPINSLCPSCDEQRSYLLSNNQDRSCRRSILLRNNRC